MLASSSSERSALIEVEEVLPEAVDDTECLDRVEGPANEEA